MNDEDRMGLVNEIDILKQVDHPNIVKLIDVYEDATTFSLVLELMTGGEVSDILAEIANHFVVCSSSSKFSRSPAFQKRKRRN